MARTETAVGGGGGAPARLPFVGRGELLERIRERWDSVREEGRTACLLLEAPEGMGKSRLLEELALRLEHPECLVRKGSAAADAGGPPDLAALLAPDSRKRPLLVLLDSCEHLAFPSLVRLAELLRAPRARGCLLVLAGRPFLLALRGCLDPWMEDRPDLPPLDETELRECWRGLFGHETSPAVAQALLETGSGNPAVLRHLLLGLREGGWVQADATGQSRLTPAEVREVAEQWVDDLCRTRLGALAPGQRRLVERLGVLGEVFSREAARLLLGHEADGLLDELEVAGLAGPPRHPALRLAGPPSLEGLVAWRDEVVARRLGRVRAPLPAAALDLLTGTTPVYSLVPFLHLERGTALPVDERRMLALLTTCEQVLLAQQRQADPSPGRRVAEALWSLLEGLHGWRDHQELRAAAGRLLAARLFLMGRQAGGAEFKRAVDLLLDLTREAVDPRLLELRLLTLIQLNRHQMRQDAGDPSGARQEIALLARNHPPLRRHRFYRVFLGDVGLMAWGRGQHATLDWVEAQLDGMLADEEDPEARAQARQRVGLTLLSHFQDRAGAELRHRQAAELATVVPGSDAAFPALRLHLLLQDGRLDSFLEHWEGARNLWQRRDLVRNLAVGDSWWRAVQALGGVDPALLAEPSPSQREVLADLPLVEAALLLGHDAWAARRLEGLTVLSAADRAGRRLQYLWAWGPTGRGAARQGLRRLDPHEEDPPRLRELAGVLVPGRGWSAEVESRAALLLARPVARLDHLLVLQTLAGQALARPALRPAVVAALDDAMDWCCQRWLGLVVRAWLQRFSTLFPAARRRAWLRRAERARLWPEAGLERAGGQGIRLEVLGPLSLRLPGQPPRRVRGARQRDLLAALALAPLLRVPLPRGEFRALAAGLDPDAPIARVRNLLALSVHRLRHQLGDEAFLSDKDGMRLNPALVTVDLHEVARELDEAERLLTQDQEAGAARHLRTVLQALATGLPFADCFHPLYDAVREDLRARSRSLALQCARRLAPAPEGRALLEALFRLDEEDEEVGDEWAAALEQDHRAAEARVVRSRSHGGAA